MDITSYMLGKKSSGGGGGSNDWANLGYPNGPKLVKNAYDYAKEIQDNWDNTETSLLSKFANDTNLLVFPYVDLSNVTTMESCFEGVSSLYEMPNNLDTSNVTSFKKCFYNNKNLRIVNIDISGATDCESMFAGCENLEEIGDITFGPDCYKRSYFFQGCKKLKRIGKIRGIAFSLSDVSTYMFGGCTSLEYGPDIDTSNMRSFAYMFGGCSALKDIPVYDFSSVSSSPSKSPFSGCTSLTNTGLQHVLQCLLTLNNEYKSSYRKLLTIGLTQEQSEYCVTLPEWQTLSSNGWTTGY